MLVRSREPLGRREGTPHLFAGWGEATRCRLVFPIQEASSVVKTLKASRLFPSFLPSGSCSVSPSPSFFLPLFPPPSPLSSFPLASPFLLFISLLLFRLSLPSSLALPVFGFLSLADADAHTHMHTRTHKRAHTCTHGILCSLASWPILWNLVSLHWSLPKCLQPPSPLDREPLASSPGAQCRA